MRAAERKEGKRRGGDGKKKIFPKAEIDLHYFARKIASKLGNILRYASAPERKKRCRCHLSLPSPPFALLTGSGNDIAATFMASSSARIPAYFLLSLSYALFKKNKSERLSCMFILMQKFSSCHT